MGTAMIDMGEFAELLQVSTRHLKRLLDRGDVIPPVRLGACLRWPRASVEAWINDGCPKYPKRKQSRSKAASDSSAGDREAAGAIEGMQEVYGSPKPVTEGIPLDLLILDPTELDRDEDWQPGDPGVPGNPWG